MAAFWWLRESDSWSWMDEIFRALADPSRRQLLDRLNERNGQTLRELCAGLDMTRQSVSKHLGILEAAGLISSRRQGREKAHFLNPAPINAIADRWMTRYDRARSAALADLKQALETSTMTDTDAAKATEMTGTETTATAAEPIDDFVYVTYIKTTPEQLWSALTEPAFTRRYWGVALVSDWQPGSTITWEMESVGVTVADPEQVVLTADPPRTLSYTWHTITDEFATAYEFDPAVTAAAQQETRSTATFEIEPAGDAVKLTVTHGGFDPGSVIGSSVSEGWPSLIASLKSLLETGEPLKF